MIKNVIFDFGGVLLDLDYNRSFDALSELMGVALQRGRLDPDFAKVLLSYEKGLMQTETFMWNIQKHAAKQISQPHKIIQAWNAMLLGWNADRLPWLLNLRQRYRTYILSNTNELHIEWVRKDLKANHEVEGFEETYFDRVYYSHDMGLRKPDKEIFEAVLSDQRIRASETLFIDDTLENVVAARSVGLVAVHHDPNLEIIDTLSSYIRQAARQSSQEE